MEKCKNSEDLCFKSVETKAKTCKDCLYYDKLCFYALLPSELNLCKDFLDKANVIEVVRCKNCVYANENGDVCYFGVGRFVTPEHYCGYAERKTEND